MELVKSGRYVAILPAKCKAKFTVSSVARPQGRADRRNSVWFHRFRVQDRGTRPSSSSRASALFARSETSVGTTEANLRKLDCVPSMAKPYIFLGLAARLC